MMSENIYLNIGFQIRVTDYIQFVSEIFEHIHKFNIVYVYTLSTFRRRFTKMKMVLIIS